MPENPALAPELSQVSLIYRTIVDLVAEKSKVLDLGCGDGTLLALLIKYKHCNGTGIEIDEKAIYQCVAKGLSVAHGDIDTGLVDYSNKRFDYVILSESLQQVMNPRDVILEALRIGKKAIVVIPNFCHISARFQMFFSGQVPVTKELPFQWYDTPNLSFLSLKDFRSFCRMEKIKISQERGISTNHRMLVMPNLFAKVGLFVLEKS